ncbi:MAG TPA: restriction endonuclease subunit S [Desulfobacter sp.]|nr:restriction endonuclease subunit S [Desulfobacter sp.]
MTDLLPLMPRYEAYKDSGVTLIGKIPEHWEILRLKNIAYINPSLSANDKKANETVCFLPMEKVGADGKVDFSTKGYLHDLINGFTSFKKNDVIIAKITPCFENKKGAFLNKMPTRLGIGSTEFHVLREKNCSNSNFLYHLTKSHLFMNLGERMMTGSAGQKRVPSEFLHIFPVALPSKIEQTTIANFLDCKTAKIDQAVAIKEEQIRLLKERKQILIQTAVTKGLDPNVPMADSGVEWIGQVPAHWNIVANRTLFKERVEPGQDDLPLLSVSIHSGISDDEVSEEENIRGRVKIEDKTKYNLVKPNDIVFNMMRAWQGAIGAAKVTGMVSPAYIIATPKETLHASYFEYQYRCPIFIQQMDRFSKGITDFRKRLYWHEFKQLLTILPPVGEQKVIVNHIQTQSAKIDQAIAIQEQMIEKLKEYKATLINAAVTGKIKVPDGRE